MTGHGPGGEDPRGFALWFLEQEMRPAAGMGLAVERAQFHLCRAVSFLEQGLLREAMQEANKAGHLDPELRPRALLIARLCVIRELAAELDL